MSDTPDDVARKLGIGDGNRGGPSWVKYAFGIAIIAAAAIFLVMSTGLDQDVRFITAEAGKSDLRITVTATGTIEPTNLVEISSELSGTLSAVNADFNDVVRKGTVLAVLDTAKLEAPVAVSKAALNSRIARVAMAEPTLEEAREKYESALRL